jgi:putative ABC transport system permease protein
MAKANYRNSVTNENFVVVTQGLQEGYELLMNEPANSHEMPYAGVENIRANQTKKGRIGIKKGRTIERHHESTTATTAGRGTPNTPKPRKTRTQGIDSLPKACKKNSYMKKSIERYIRRYWHDVVIAFEAILANKVKSLLTALGIMFGVAAVISMLAIGKGAQQEVLEQIKLVGVNNIIVTPSSTALDSPDDAASEEGQSGSQKRFSRGLTLLDAKAIQEALPTVQKVSPVISFNYFAVLKGKSYPVVLEGVSGDYFELLNMTLANGEIFTPEQDEMGLPVCVIGDNIRNRFFNQENPIGQYIKCGQNWLKVVGVVEKRDFTASASDEMGISSSDNKIFIPIKTMLLRFKDRGKINPELLEQMARGGQRFISAGAQTGETSAKSETNHQLDKIIVQVSETEYLGSTADIIKRMLLRRHSDIYDFEVTVPELLLKQQQKTNDIFNLVLGAIASISLVVGGIGIMNIMLASVWERIREIGTRQAIGASRKDIVVQFLAESTLISISGGIIGIVLGVLLAHLIHMMSDIKTIVSPFSVIIAFGVSASVGVIFGYLPAKRAAEQDPVESLRQ